jgi:HlyD family secretion protein
MRKIIKITLVTAVMVALVAAGGWAWQSYGSPRDTVAFRTTAVERGELTAVISATGTIEPEEVIDVGSQVAAQIRNFGADPHNAKKTIDYGTLVHENTLLAQLDDSLFKARVEQAQAAVEEAKAQILQANAGIKRAEADLGQLSAKMVQAERDWERAQKLKLSRSIADLEFDAARAAFETTQAYLNVGDASLAQAKVTKQQAEKSLGRVEASLREAQVNLGYTQIRSPVEGVILDRRVNVGQTVVAGLNAPSLFLIAKDLKRLQVWASVNEADIGQIHSGQNVRFTVDAYPKETFIGQVAQIRLNASMTQNVVTYTVVVSTDNSQGKLLPYMTASLQFEVDRRADTLLLPNAALRWKPRPAQIAPDARGTTKKNGKNGEKESSDRATVWVVDGEFVRPVPIQMGLSDGAQTEIRSGDLKEGDQIIVGTRRTITNDDAGGTPFAPKMFGGGKKS